MYFLVKKDLDEGLLDVGKTTQFLSKIQTIMTNSILEIINPIMRKFDVIVNRFVTGRFELDSLLNDFKTIYRSILPYLKYTDSINNFLMKILNTKLEHKMVSKIMTNPNRFVFSNAINWNSFISAFISDERVEMEMLHELIAILMMAQNLSMEPSILKDISHHFTPNQVGFIMKNYKPDMMIPKPIDYSEFAKFYRIKEIETRIKIPEPPFPDIEEAKAGLVLENWNKLKVDQNVLKEFPWLKNYCE